MHCICLSLAVAAGAGAAQHRRESAGARPATEPDQQIDDEEIGSERGGPRARAVRWRPATGRTTAGRRRTQRFGWQSSRDTSRKVANAVGWPLCQCPRWSPSAERSLAAVASRQCWAARWRYSAFLAACRTAAPPPRSCACSEVCRWPCRRPWWCTRPRSAAAGVVCVRWWSAPWMCATSSPRWRCTISDCGGTADDRAMPSKATQAAQVRRRGDLRPPSVAVRRSINIRRNQTRPIRHTIGTRQTTTGHAVRRNSQMDHSTIPR